MPEDACRSRMGPPQVVLVEPRCDDGDDEVDLELLCIVWSSAMEKTQVSWLLNGEEMSPPVPGSGLEGGRSSLTIKRSSWDKGDLYTCKVTTAWGRDVVMRNTSKCTACWGATTPPELFLTLPSYADLLAGPALATCLLLGWHLRGATISWAGDLPRNRDLTFYPNGTQGLLLGRRLSLEEWWGGDNLSCRATLPCRDPLSRSLVMGPRRDLSWKPPVVNLSRVPSAAGGWFLFCHVTGFSPPDLLLHWTGGRDLRGRSQDGPIAGREVFSTFSLLQLEEEEEEEGRAYACVVNHPTLKTPLVVTSNTSLPPPTPRSPVMVSTEPWAGAGLPLAPCGLLGEGEELEAEEDGSHWATVPTFAVLFLLLLCYSGLVTFLKVK